MTFEWNEAQRQAIYCRDENILVAAGAGSGKTTVLVERVVQRLLAEEDPLSVDQLLVLTFTNAAAQEMRQRIDRRLSERLEAAPSERLQDQLALLPQAAIGTIHSFCLEVIRRNFIAAGIDAGFRIPAEADVTLLAAEVLERYLDEQYRSGAEQLFALADAYGGKRDDSELNLLILNLYRFVISQPDAEGWLDAAAARFAAAAMPPQQEAAFRQLLIEELQAAEDQLRQAADLAARHHLPDTLTGQLWEEADALLALRNAPTAEELLARLAELSFARLKAVRLNDDEQKRHKEEAQAMRNAAKKLVQKLQSVFGGRTMAELWADMNALAPLMAELTRLTKGFMAEFAAEKRRRNWLDFSDMEHLCLKVLADETNGVAAAYRERFAEVLVDEYQDTNAVQEAILNLLERGDNRFAVGDVKQSIYRFRMADPGLFLHKYLLYGAGEGGRRIDLNSNYRSKSNILQAVNFIFSRLMSEELGDIVYDDAAALHPGAEAQAGGEMVEFHIIDLSKQDEDEDGGDDEDDMQFGEDFGPIDGAAGENAEDRQEKSLLAAEVALVICRIRDLLAQGCKLSDMVILLRSTKNRENFVAEKLQEADMLAVTGSGSDALAAPEVRLIVAALRVIDNPLNDLPLATLLRSPLVGFSADELTEIRLAGSGYYYHGLCARAAAEDAFGSKCAAFIAKLQRWQNLAKEERLSQLIAQLLQENGYFRLVGAMADGEQRQEHLHAFIQLAREYERSNYRGLYRFLCYLQDTEKRRARVAESQKPEEQQAVRIMSIHKSKGLEFPIVFVCGMGSRFSFRNDNNDVLWHKELGLGPMLADRSRRIKYPTLAHRLVAWQNDHDARAEELRILYVALTRAKERLIIVGADRNLRSSLARWRQTAECPGALPATVLRRDSRPLDWLARALATHPGGWEICFRADGSMPRVAPQDSRFGVYFSDGHYLLQLLHSLPQQLQALQDTVSLPPAEWQATEQQAAVDAVLSYRYPYADACNYPAKWSVSQLNSEQTQRFIPARTEDAGEDLRREAALRRGTLNHLLLQFVDFAAADSAAAVAAQAAELIARGLLDAEELALVDIPALYGFICSPLGQRMAGATRLWREFPFTALLPAAGRVEAAADDALLLQGTIDALFEEDGRLILVDYKTGGRGKTDTQLAASYRVQLQQYARAVELLFGTPPAEAWLYMLDLQRTVKVEL